MLILLVIVMTGVLIAFAIIAYSVLAMNRAVGTLTEMVTTETAAVDVLNRSCDAVTAAIETTGLLVEATRSLASELQIRLLALSRNGVTEPSRH